MEDFYVIQLKKLEQLPYRLWAYYLFVIIQVSEQSTFLIQQSDKYYPFVYFPVFDPKKKCPQKS